MPRYICKIKTKYFEWSSAVEAPVTKAMPLKRFKEYYLKEYGVVGYKGLKQRLKRVQVQGTSCRLGHTLDDFIELSILNGGIKSKAALYESLNIKMK